MGGVVRGRCRHGPEALRLLLDTHIWLWSLLEPQRLARHVAHELESAPNELWLSPISVWETLLLAERGRLELDAPPAAWVERQLRDVPVREAPLTREVAVRSRALDLVHDDPADRFIAATAAVFDLTLVTADARLLATGSFPTLANR